MIRTSVATACLFLTALAVQAEEPVELVPVQDKTISSTEPGLPHKVDGERSSLRLMAGQEKHRICMYFEFKEQAARPCGGAVLRLTTEKCWPNTKDQYIRVHRLLRPFAELFTSWTDSVEADTWINQGGDFDPTAICARKISQKDEGAGKTIDFDVTPLVQMWQSKRVPNYGLILMLDDGSDMNIHVTSRENGSKPKLLLYYASAPPKNPDMIPLTALKPIGVMPQFKTEVLTQSLNKGAVGADYKARLLAKGGIAPYSWKAIGIPEGLVLAEDGHLTGKPAQAGHFTLQLTVTGADKRSANGRIELEIGGEEKTAVAGAEPKKTETPKSERKSGGLEDE